MEDEQIIELFFQRSEQAIRELDSKYGRVCHALSCRIVNDRRDAEECVSDAYLGVWNTVPPARPSPLLAYLCRIVRNLSLKCWERRGAAKRGGAYTVALEEIEGCVADLRTPEGEAEARELTRAIEGFLDTLTTENRVIFLRRYWFADSCGDIARRVGLTEKNVSVRLTRIRRKLREYLKEREVLV